MSTHLEFYLQRAAEARADADTATLANVRDRCLRSAEAWSQMAQRAEKAERLRCENETAKAALLAE